MKHSAWFTIVCTLCHLIDLFSDISFHIAGEVSRPWSTLWWRHHLKQKSVFVRKSAWIQVSYCSSMVWLINKFRSFIIFLIFTIIFWILRFYLTVGKDLFHCCLVTPYDDRDLGQHWLRQSWLLAWRHQAISYTNVYLSPVWSSFIHLKAFSREITQPLWTKINMKSTYLKFQQISTTVALGNDVEKCHLQNGGHQSVNVLKNAFFALSRSWGSVAT